MARGDERPRPPRRFEDEDEELRRRHPPGERGSRTDKTRPAPYDRMKRPNDDGLRK